MTIAKSHQFTILIATFCVIWSAAFAIGRAGLLYCPPMTLLSLRFLIGAVLATALAAALGQRPPAGRALVLVAMVGVVNHALYLGLSYMGMRHHVPSGLTAIIVSANPVLTTVLAAWLLEERLHWRKLLGLGLGVAGVLFILRHRIEGGAEAPAQLVWPLGALVALSAGTVLYKRWDGGPNGSGGFAILAVQLWAATLVAAVPALWLEGGWDQVHPTATFWGSLLLQGCVISVGAYWIWFYLLRHGAASSVSSWSFLTPPLGVLFGWLLLDEHVAWIDLAGIVPVALGIVLVTRSRISPRLQPQR